MIAYSRDLTVNCSNLITWMDQRCTEDFIRYSLKRTLDIAFQLSAQMEHRREGGSRRSEDLSWVWASHSCVFETLQPTRPRLELRWDHHGLFRGANHEIRGQLYFRSKRIQLGLYGWEPMDRLGSTGHFSHSFATENRASVRKLSAFSIGIGRYLKKYEGFRWTWRSTDLNPSICSRRSSRHKFGNLGADGVRNGKVENQSNSTNS